MSEKVKSVFSLADLGISTDEKDLAVMPSGGEFFGETNFIAPFKSAVMTWFLAENSIVEYNAENDDEDKLPVPTLVIPAGDWFNYYYDDYASADTAFKGLCPGKVEDGFKVATAWAVWTDTDSVINVPSDRRDELIKGFGPSIHYNVRVQTLRRGSNEYAAVNRHQWNYITLPALISAAATVMGIDNPGYDLSDLLEEGFEYTDENFEQYCGDLHGEYDKSTLHTRRAALWKTLGEDDPRKSAVKGSKTAKGKPSSAATDSDALSQCFYLAQSAWKSPIWCRLIGVPDPMPGAIISKNDRRKTVPAVVEIFGVGQVGEARARAAAEEELKDSGNAPTHPPMPPNWAGAGTTPEALVQWFNDEFYGKIAKLPEDQWASRASFDSLDNLKAWLSWAEG